MEIKYEYILYAHIATGGLALATGLISAFLKKGSKRHSNFGKVFALSMATSAAIAVALSIFHPNPFLLGIGFFTLYLVSSGWVWIRRMPFDKKLKLTKAIGAAGILTAAYMIYIGIINPLGAIILYVLGGILATLSFTDLVLKTTPDKAAGKHGGRMGGALIAAITAFLVTNFPNLDSLHPLVIWLGPTVIGTPLIILGIRRFYKRKTKTVAKS
ncbi:hypothetical protein O3Q51_05395 [Cryomorphaceae bacterium 1068]|nr:hypothetical protein [Cryomorphaceae bacterium 1068]